MLNVLKPQSYYNRLAFPAGAATGLNTSHVALTAGQPVLSGIVTGNNVITISPTPAIAGTISVSPTFFTDAIAGQVIQTIANDSSYALIPGISFTGSGWTRATCGIIFATGTNPGGPAGFGCLVHFRCAGFAIHNNFGGPINLVLAQPIGGGSIDSGLAIVANTPYFAAVSFDTTLGNANFVLLNLRNGSLKSTTGVPPATGSAANTVYVGNDVNGNTASGCGISCFAVQNSYASLQSLLQWAKSPWSFWYPKTENDWS